MAESSTRSAVSGSAVADLSRREILVLAPLVAFMIFMGVYPKPFLEKSEVTVMELLQTVDSKRAVQELP